MVLTVLVALAVWIGGLYLCALTYRLLTMSYDDMIE